MSTSLFLRSSVELARAHYWGRRQSGRRMRQTAGAVMGIIHDEGAAHGVEESQMAIARDFVFVGRLCLDLVHTGDMGYGRLFERLTVPSELRRWLSLSPLRLTAVRTTPKDLEQAKR